MKAILLALLLASVASAAAAVPRPDPATVEMRARALQKELRCVVCQGQSLDQSDAPLAADLRHLIREKIVAGWSDEAVERYLVARYGNFVLMKPPLEPHTYLLWFGPAAILLIGAGVAAAVLLRAGRRNRESPPSGLA